MSKPITAAAWKKSAVHTITCPSGAVIGIRIPNIPQLVESGQLPQHLLESALGAANDAPTPTEDLIKQEREFTDFIVKTTVVEPEIKDVDLPEIPYEDKEFIVSIATRQRDLDAVGDHIGGLSASAKFRRFRGLGEFSENVESL